MTARTHPFRVSTGQPFRMRKGVGVRMHVGRLDSEKLRGSLREKWVGCLSEQDRGAWRPHWTVMNKVGEEEVVERAFEEVGEVLGEEGPRGRAVGVTLWRYLPSGRWEEGRVFGFSAGKEGTE